jgi:hypothetical protein
MSHLNHQLQYQKFLMNQLSRLIQNYHFHQKIQRYRLSLMNQMNHFHLMFLMILMILSCLMYLNCLLSLNYLLSLRCHLSLKILDLQELQ